MPPRILAALLGAIALAIPQGAGAVTLLPPPGRVFTGVAMGDEIADFARRTGRRPAVWEQFVAWRQSYAWAIRLAEGEGTRLLLAVSTASGQDRPETISPGAIAAGRGDRWLLALRADLATFGGPVYLRLMGEMNNCRNAYAPLSCSGRSRGASHSAAAFRAAWRRTAVIMRATGDAEASRELRALRQPPLGGSLGAAAPRVAMVWTPMTAGSPMVAALDPGRFWPGGRWVDWVGTSFYSRFANFRWLTPYYQRFSARYRKPFMFAEWAMWENGDPTFVRRTLAWIRAHPRTRMLVYNQGKRSDGPFRLSRFPAAASLLKDGLRSPAFGSAPRPLG